MFNRECRIRGLNPERVGDCQNFIIKATPLCSLQTFRHGTRRIQAGVRVCRGTEMLEPDTRTNPYEEHTGKMLGPWARIELSTLQHSAACSSHRGPVVDARVPVCIVCHSRCPWPVVSRRAGPRPVSLVSPPRGGQGHRKRVHSSH